MLPLLCPLVCYFRCVIDTAGIVCGLRSMVYVAVGCPSVSVPSIDRCNSVRRVYCWAPLGLEYRPSAAALNSTAASSKCEQCHVYSRRRRLNTDVLILYIANEQARRLLLASARDVSVIQVAAPVTVVTPQMRLDQVWAECCYCSRV